MSVAHSLIKPGTFYISRLFRLVCFAARCYHQRDMRRVEEEEKPHRQLRMILVMIIFSTIPCYCLGLFAALQAPRDKNTPTLSLTATSIKLLTPTLTLYVTYTPSVTPFSSIVTYTITPSPTRTLTITPTRTYTPSPTLSPSPSGTATMTLTSTPVPSDTPSSTATLPPPPTPSETTIETATPTP